MFNYVSRVSLLSAYYFLQDVGFKMLYHWSPFSHFTSVRECVTKSSSFVLREPRLNFDCMPLVKVCKLIAGGPIFYVLLCKRFLLYKPECQSPPPPPPRCTDFPALFQLTRPISNSLGKLLMSAFIFSSQVVV